MLKSWNYKENRTCSIYTGGKMKIAYFIMAHKNPLQIKKLLSAIYSPENVYVIHIDKKSGLDLYNDIDSFARQLPNIFLLESQDVTWAMWSIVEIQLRALKFLFDYEWDFFINLSGQDFPLQSQAYIKNYLRHNNKNHINIIDADLDKRVVGTFEARQMYEYKVDNGFIVRFGELASFSEFYPGHNFHIGSGWFVLKRDFCEHIFISEKLEGLITYFSKIYIPDESFFHTFFMLSPYKNDLINAHKRTIIMDQTELSLHPIIFKNDDYEFLISSDNLFARKFDENIDKLIIDKLYKNAIS
ncbi:MAG: glycosyl transferase [Bacilli bacterium]|nr:glycosyl transferase [Bacilli bacterium]